MNSVQLIKSLFDIVDQYKVFLIDQWGVMHDGTKGFPHAIKCIKKLIRLEKKIIIISNSSKRKKKTIERLPELGFDRYDFIEVMTSGELVWQNLYSKSHHFIKNLGKKCYHLTDRINQDNIKFVDGLDYEIVSNIDEANFILGCITSPNLTTLDYIPLLKKAIQGNLPFVCANPDFESVEVSSKNLVICMGTIAKLYKDFGGSVFMMGKPSNHIYNEATKNVLNIDKTKLLAIGDSLFHDIKGAISFGIDSLLVTSGIHKSEFDQYNPIWDHKNNNLCKLGIKPTYLISKFQF